MDGVVAATNVGNAGLAHYIIIKSLEAGKKTSESEEAEIKKETEELIKSVPRIYNCQGELIEYSNLGRHLNMGR